MDYKNLADTGAQRQEPNIEHNNEWSAEKRYH